MVPKTGAQGEVDSIIDTGCTHISLPLCQKLDIQMKPLASPIHYEQINGSLIGGAPAILVTESIRLEMDHHWEFIWFVVVPKMTETIILGLDWLDKWGPTISWEDGY